MSRKEELISEHNRRHEIDLKLRKLKKMTYFETAIGIALLPLYIFSGNIPATILLVVLLIKIWQVNKQEQLVIYSHALNSEVLEVLKTLADYSIKDTTKKEK